jgi:hypothetical protein
MSAGSPPLILRPPAWPEAARAAVISADAWAMHVRVPLRAAATRNTLARTDPPMGAEIVPAANSHDSKTEYSAVIYLSGMDRKQLDDTERCCRDYANRFGWRVLESIQDTSPGQLLAKAIGLRPQIILTGTLDMISPDQSTRNDLMMSLERAQCIIHPVTTPGHYS